MALDGITDYSEGRLTARPALASGDLLEPGLHKLGLGDAVRDGLIYVPDAGGPRPLMLVLHGATMKAEWMARPLVAAADDAGLIMVIPDSRELGTTWDVLVGGYGPDVAYCDAALEYAFAHCNVSPTQISIGGISDGASYALSLGIMNGDLFEAIVAWSPGFLAPKTQVGTPRVFLSHGTQDSVLPIDRCGRPIAVGLHNNGYEVEYIEFNGGHEMPDPIIRASFGWLTDPQTWAGKGTQ
ncbi:MAG: phospholipase/carboxylesterase [Actinomycetota bacterium]